MEMAGHYRNFSVILAKEDAWYRVDRLFSAVMTIRKMDLSCPSDQKDTWSLINNMNSGFPATETTRFPENEFYIRESEGSWATIFVQLWSGLNQLDKKYDKEADAEAKVVQRLVDMILTNLCDKYLVIDRADFERKNKLTWEAPNDSN